MDEPYATNTTCRELARRLGAARRVALVSHQKPDGDAMGSLLALARALAGRGQEPDLLLLGPVEPNLLALTGDTPWRLADDGAPGDEHDLIVVVDTGAWSQLEPVAEWLRRHHGKVVGLDHHARGDDVVSARIVDPTAAATTVMLVDLLDEMGVPITGETGGVGEALFLGLATDTGWFRFPNADARAFAVAARLLESGVDKTRLYRLTEESYRPQRLALMARALASVRWAREQAVAVLALSLDDFEETGGSFEDLTTLVNLPMAVASVRVAVLLAQTEPGVTKISFRSKRPVDEDEAARLGDVWNVNELARRFGGGGHVHASGARVAMDLEEALKAVMGAVGEEGAA